jgi:3-oxoacyl-[acyl-carrier protein] reductase
MSAKKELMIVTGASRGIGKGIALHFAKEGMDIMIFGRDAAVLKKTEVEIKKFGVECEGFVGDVSDEVFVNNSVIKILEKYGKVDHLINNAGTRVFKNVVDASLDDFKLQVNANLYGVFNFSRAVLKGMIERKQGSIINISSLAGKNAFATGAMYAATKHALMGFTASMFLEVREYNIRVASICPGSVNTEFFDGLSMKPNKEKILQVEDIAEAVAAVLKLPIRALISEIEIRPTNPK